MTCGARPLISPHAFKRPRSPMRSVFRMQLTNCLDQNLLATYSRKRNYVVQVVCECGGSRLDLPLGSADPERIASQTNQTSWFRMSAEVREAVDHRATAKGLSWGSWRFKSAIVLPCATSGPTALGPISAASDRVGIGEIRPDSIHPLPAVAKVI